MHLKFGLNSNHLGRHNTHAWIIKQYLLSLIQVTSRDQLVVIDRGILIPRAELNHGGIYHCQLEEHSFRWTAVTIRLSVWSPTQPMYKDMMTRIRHSDLVHYCKELGKQHHDHKKSREKEQVQERKRGDRQKHGGERGEKDRGKGRKNRSKMGSSASRSPRST